MNRHKTNILFLTSWTHREPLLESYVLPNIKIIRSKVGAEAKLFLQTHEGKEMIDTDSYQQFVLKNRAIELETVSTLFLPFGIRSLIYQIVNFWNLAKVIRSNKITHLHSFAPPASAMAWVLNCFFSVVFVADSWEPHADAMVETGTWKKGGVANRMMFFLEKRISQSANFLVAASPAMLGYCRESYRVEPKGKILFRPACVQMDVFDPSLFQRNEWREEYGLEKKVVCICASKLGGLYLGKEVIRFFKAGELIFGSSFHAILLSSYSAEIVLSWCVEEGLSSSSITHKMVPYAEVTKYLAMADFAFNPQCPVPSKRYGTPVKDGEYWAMGLPLVILPNISDDSEIVVRENAGVILKDTSIEEMKSTMRKVKSRLELYSSPDSAIREVARKYRSYALAGSAYSEIYL